MIPVTREEHRTLWGCIIILAGILLPWHSFHYGYPFPGIMPELHQGIVRGLDLAGGQMMVAALLLIAVLTLLPHRPEWAVRVITARMFTNHAVLALFLITGLGPTLTTWNVEPHLGLAFVFVGWVLVFASSRRALRLNRQGTEPAQ